MSIATCGNCEEPCFYCESGGPGCPDCEDMEKKIEELRAEVTRLKAALEKIEKLFDPKSRLSWDESRRQSEIAREALREKEGGQV